MRELDSEIRKTIDEELKDRLTLLGRKLRSYAKWDCTPGYYSDKAESSIAYAKSELAETIANMIDETFDVDSRLHGLTRKEIYGD